MSIQIGLKERVGYSKIKLNYFAVILHRRRRDKIMKRKIVSLLITVLTLTLCFTGCYRVQPIDGPESDAPSKKTESTEKKTLSEAGKTAKITIQIEDNNGENKVQIPKFESDTESAAITELNKQIEDVIIDFYNTAKSRKNEWPLISTRNFDYERYLQSVVQYEAFPDIEGASVKTYVYDKYKDKPVSLDDAYSLAGTTAEKIRKGVEKARITSETASVNNLEVQGFMITKSGDTEFFVKYEYDSGMDAVNELMTFIPSTGELHQMTNDGVYIAE